MTVCLAETPVQTGSTRICTICKGQAVYLTCHEYSLQRAGCVPHMFIECIDQSMKSTSITSADVHLAYCSTRSYMSGVLQFSPAYAKTWAALASHKTTAPQCFVWQMCLMRSEKCTKQKKRASSDGSAGQPCTATAPKRSHTSGNVCVTVSAKARHTCFKQYLGMAHRFHSPQTKCHHACQCIMRS